MQYYYNILRTNYLSIVSLFFGLSLIILNLSCTKRNMKNDRILSFKNNIIYNWEHGYNGSSNSWYLQEGSLYHLSDANIESVSLIPDVLTKRAEIAYLFNKREIPIYHTEFEGEYQKKKNIGNTDLEIGLEYLDNNDELQMEIIEINIESEDTLWHKFKIDCNLNDKADQIKYIIINNGRNAVALRNCSASADGVQISKLIPCKPQSSPRLFTDFEEVSTQKLDYIKSLGEIWGYLKYYHPVVCSGLIDWDQELFKMISKVNKVTCNSEFNLLISEWIENLGPLTPNPSTNTVDQSNSYSKKQDIGWLKNNNILNSNVVEILDKVHNSSRSKRYNYYLVDYMPFRQHLDRELTYGQDVWTNQYFRILSFLRLLNVIEYCFPYIEISNFSWSQAFDDYIQSILHPSSKDAYELTLLEVVTCIKDSHANLSFPDRELIFQYKNQVPIELMQSKEEEVVVCSTQSSSFVLGDIIKKVDDLSIDEIIKKKKPYVPASNYSFLVKRVLDNLVRTNNPNIKIAYERNGRLDSVVISNFSHDQRCTSIKTWKDYNIYDILYINMSQPLPDDLEPLLEGTKALILDLRNNTTQTNYEVLNKLLFSNRTEYIWFSENDKMNPGNFAYRNAGAIGSVNKNAYNKKVAILVSSNTQSIGEMLSMAYRTIPKSVIIGSQTAGSNGNISRVALPEGLVFTFTGLGAYYPNWENSQGVGVKIDIKISPSNTDILSGRDLWIETAISYINNQN